MQHENRLWVSPAIIFPLFGYSTADLEDVQAAFILLVIIS